MDGKVKKGVLIFPILKDLNAADGILVKNEGIRKGFLQNGVDVDVLEFVSSGVFNKDEKVYTFHSSRYKRIIQHNYLVWEKIANYIRYKDYDFIWLRISILTSAVANFLGSVKRNNPKTKIILEYGAYPFVRELTKLKKAIYYINLYNEKKGHRSSDFIITYCGQDRVDNLVNIPIDNGVDIENIPIVNNQPPVSKQINFISVSSLKKWHAYERFIEGIALYAKKENAMPVRFHIVGYGPEYEKLTQLAEKLNVNKQVVFHSFKTGKQLDDIYNQSHIAIGTLGFHRIGINNSSSLKNREYFARGLPIIVSTPDKDMPGDLPFVKYVPAGEEPINIEDMVRFAHEVYIIPDLNHLVRDYAEENVTWKSKIRTVLNYLNDSAFIATSPVKNKMYS
jgi:hypothetical protein